MVGSVSLGVFRIWEIKMHHEAQSRTQVLDDVVLALRHHSSWIHANPC